MNWLISGGSGLIGSALTRELLARGEQVRILTRQPGRQRADGAELVQWDGRNGGDWYSALALADVIVHLAGENIGAGLWTAARKQAFLTSRLENGNALVTGLLHTGHRPQAFIQGSAVGYYGDCSEKLVDEHSAAGHDFLSQLAVAWEKSTEKLESSGIRRVIIRTGVVLSENADVLERMMLPFKLFAGGPLGSGRQYIPWIHLADEVSAIQFLAENPRSAGVYNLVSPQPVTNAQFGRSLAKIMGRPYWLPAPAFLLRLVLGEMSQLVLDGQRAVPQRLLAEGFNFRFDHLEAALRDIL
jgi:uncharacterized protein (TIGR01777 family)